MKLKLKEMQTVVTTKPNLVLASCTRVNVGTDAESIVFDTRPTNLALYADPVEETPGEIWAVLEDLDYVAV